MGETQRRILFLTAFAAAFFVLGAGFNQSFVHDAARKAAGAEGDLRAYAYEAGARTVPAMLGPRAAELLLLAGLYWLRPAAVPRWAVALGLALALAAFVVAALFESPTRAELAKMSTDPELVDRLIALDGTRRLIDAARAALYVGVAAVVMRPGVDKTAVVTGGGGLAS